MNNEGKFGLIETVSLTSIAMTSKIFYTSLSTVVKGVGTSAWIMTIVSCITTLLIFLMIYKLMKRFEGKDLIEIFEAVTGKVIGKILALVLCSYLIYYSGMNLREFLEMLKAYNLPYTPPSIILAVVIGSAAIFVYLGLETIARISYLAFVSILVGIIAILLMGIPEYNLKGMLPIFGYGLGHTLYTGVLRSSVYSEVIFLTIIIKSLHGLKHFKKAGLISIILTGVIFSIAVLLYVMAFNYTAGSENLSGLFQLSRVIYFNRFFQRVESIFLLIWSSSSILLVTIAFYMAISIYSKTFGISNYKPLILPFTFILFMVSILPRNLSEVINIYILSIRQYGFIVTYFIPITVFLIAIILRKKGGSLKHEKL